MTKKKAGLSLKARQAILILLIFVAGSLIYIIYQGYFYSTEEVSAESYWVDQEYQIEIADFVNDANNPEQDAEQAIKASQNQEIKRAMALPQADVLPPPSDTAAWDGKAPLSEGKVIQIVLGYQRLLAWQDGQLLGYFLASTGKPGFGTKQGSFEVLTKLEMAYGSGNGDTWAMPYWLGFYMTGGTENGMHGLPYINGYKEGWGSLGHPVSHGCVRIADANQYWLYNWAELDMPVIVQWDEDSIIDVTRYQ